MKVHSKGPHNPVSSTSHVKGQKGITSKGAFRLSQSSSLEEKHMELFNRIKERVKKERIQGSDKILRVVTEEMLRGSLRLELGEKQFQRMVDRISESVSNDPVLSGMIKKIMAKIS